MGGANGFGIVGNPRDGHPGEMPTFIDPELLDRLRVGPLASYLDAYLKRIEQEGFLPSSVPMQMYGIARLSNWLQTRQPDLHLLDEATIERFLQRDQNIVLAPNLHLCGAF